MKIQVKKRRPQVIPIYWTSLPPATPHHHPSPWINSPPPPPSLTPCTLLKMPPSCLTDWISGWGWQGTHNRYLSPLCPPHPLPPLPVPQIMIKTYPKKHLLHIFLFFDCFILLTCYLLLLMHLSWFVCLLRSVLAAILNIQMGFYFFLHLCFMCHVQQRLRRNHIYLCETTPIFTFIICSHKSHLVRKISSTFTFIICSHNPILFARSHQSLLSSSVVRIPPCSQDLTNLHFHHL